MSKAIVQPGQSLADIAVQHLGSFDKIAELAVLNGLALTGSLQPGQALTLPTVADKRIVAFFKQGNYVPASGQVITTGEGISFMGIEFDFIVS